MLGYSPIREIYLEKYLRMNGTYRNFGQNLGFFQKKIFQIEAHMCLMCAHTVNIFRQSWEHIWKSVNAQYEISVIRCGKVITMWEKMSRFSSQRLDQHHVHPPETAHEKEKERAKRNLGNQKFLLLNSYFFFPNVFLWTLEVLKDLLTSSNDKRTAKQICHWVSFIHFLGLFH